MTIAEFAEAQRSLCLCAFSALASQSALGYTFVDISEENPPMAKQRILLVDDHEVVRLGLKSLLERNPQFEAIGEAG